MNDGAETRQNVLLPPSVPQPLRGHADPRRHFDHRQQRKITVLTADAGGTCDRAKLFAKLHAKPGFALALSSLRLEPCRAYLVGLIGKLNLVDDREHSIFLPPRFTSQFTDMQHDLRVSCSNLFLIIQLSRLFLQHSALSSSFQGHQRRHVSPVDASKQASSGGSTPSERKKEEEDRQRGPGARLCLR